MGRSESVSSNPAYQAVTFWSSHNDPSYSPQRDFFTAGPQPTLYFGGVGSGKTYVGVMKLLRLLDQYPGSRGVIVRQRFQQLKKTTAATLWKLLPRQFIANRNSNEGTLTLKNGSQLLLMHLDKSDSLNNLKSLEINFAFVDQLEDLSSEAWDTLIERVGRWSGATRVGGWPADWPHRDRRGVPIPPRYAFANCYSPGYDHWITKRWWEHGEDRAMYAAKGYRVIFGSTRDNLALSEDYVQDRLSQGSEYVKRFVDAVEWGANEGRIFTLRPESILEPTEELIGRIQRTMRLHRVYDHGEFSPAACLWYATDDKGNVIYYREYMAADRLVSEHRRAIFDMSKPDGWGDQRPQYTSNYADPAIFAKNRGKTANSKATWSVADEWLDTRIVEPETAVWWRPAVNDEAATINRVKEYLRYDTKHYNPFKKTVGSPRVFFVRRTPDYPFGCHEVLADIRNARRVEIGVKADGSKMFGDERDEKVRDHLLDGVRYSLIMRPSRGKAEPPPPPEPGMIPLSVFENARQEAEWRLEVEARREPPTRKGYGYGS